MARLTQKVTTKQHSAKREVLKAEGPPKPQLVYEFSNGRQFFDKRTTPYV